jgi:site-specific recombinase XerD
MRPTDFGFRLTAFLGSYLPAERGASPHTISSYRDTFALMLRFANSECGIGADRFTLSDLTAEFTVAFLAGLEGSRKSTPATRNVRLAAIRSFVAYLQYIEPVRLAELQKILAIPVKKTVRPTVTYAKTEGIRLLLSMPDTATAAGRRDLALLSLMYDCAARVSEITALTPSCLRLDNPPTASIIGKGNKVRVVPLSGGNVSLLKRYLEENGLDEPKAGQYPLFCNHGGDKLTSAGVSYILKRYVSKARTCDPLAIPEKFSCHSMRHSRSMSLLDAGVPLIYIRDILGHASVQTTEIYARVDGRRKREAIEAAYQPILPGNDPVWLTNKGLLEWLRDFNR